MPAYIGRSPVYGSFQKQDFTPNGSTTSFTLDIGVSNSESIILVVSGVVQEPGTGKAYTANGTTSVSYTHLRDHETVLDIV